MRKVARLLAQALTDHARILHRARLERLGLGAEHRQCCNLDWLLREREAARAAMEHLRERVNTGYDKCNNAVISRERADMPQNRDEVTDAVLAFVKAQSWGESYRIVMERQDVLLTAAADEVLADLLTQYRDDENATYILVHRRELLTRCRRQQGIDTAIASYLQLSAATPASELEYLLKELPSLSASGEMPRRIAVCREALSLLDRNDQPELWAGLEVELGDSLLSNLQVERAENIEEAISHCEQALEVYNREALPIDWAATQHSLANAYSARIRGDKAKNIEEAISRYELALEVRTRQDYPLDWARTHNNLAIAYDKRIQGERCPNPHALNKESSNIEEAISHHERTLEVYTRENFPVQWAHTQRSLATAYLNRGPIVEEDNYESDNIGEAIVEDGRRALERAEAWAKNERDNIKEAFSRYGLALEVYTREDFPAEWARTQENLGSACRPRNRSKTTEDLKEGISCCERALEVYTREDFPVEWERTQNNLAEAYEDYTMAARSAFLNAQTREKSRRIVEEHRDVLLTDALDESLSIKLTTEWDGHDDQHHHTLEEQLTLLGRCRREGIDAAFAGLSQSPAAIPENKLEALIRELDKPSLRGDILRRIAACRDALALIDRSGQSELWAWLHLKLGDSLRRNSQGNQVKAISCYERALKVYTREDFPVEWARIQNGLARAYQGCTWAETTENRKLAIYHYELALEVYTRRDFPADWAWIQDRLPKAYLTRGRVNRWNWDHLRETMLSVDEIIMVAVLAFVDAEKWDTSKRTVWERQDVLLTETADKLLADLLNQYEDDHATYHTLTEHRELLARCRREGIHAAFYDRLGDPVAPSGSMLKDLSNELKDWIEEKGHWIVFAVELLKEIWTHGSTPVGRSNRAEAEVLAESQEWAESHVALSSRLQEDPRADRAENIEDAISHLKQALQAYTRQGFLAESKWAMTYQELAKAYENRIRGDRAQNIEEAISYLERVFERTFRANTREHSPVYWAATHHNLAGAYANRIRGNREQNVEESIRHYSLALEVRTKGFRPVDWAATQHDLAKAYENRIRGDREQNIEKAVSRYELALEVRTRQDYLVDWASTHNNLASAYRSRGEESSFARAENIEEAISHCELALEVYTRENFPVEWARTQHNLANVYRDRIKGEKEQNIEVAISCFRSTLEVLTPDTLPQECRNTAFGLGYLLYGEHRFAEARVAIETAHKAVEALRAELQREDAKRKLAEENADLYARLVHCCLIEGDEQAAFEYAVAGKGRAFVDMLATARFDLSAAGADDPHLAEDLRRARELRQQIDNLLARLFGESGTSPDEDAEEQRSARSEMHTDLRSLKDQEARHWEEISYRYPALTATQQAPTLSVGDAQRLSEEMGATLIEYYRHAGGWCAFVVTSDSLYHVSLPDMDSALGSMAKWFGWIELGKLKFSYGPLRQLHRALIAPLREYLSPGGRVVLAPFAGLHLLPLVAALDPATGRYAAEDYTLTFAPNLAALRTAQQQGTASAGGQEAEEDLLSVAYPGVPESANYLPNVLPEAEAVSRHFARVTPLYEEDATPDAVVSHARGQDVLHLGCHGNFEANSPQQSGLMLSGGWLTVQRVITEMDLQETRLATIGACLSGRIQIRQGEEHVGLVQAMMSAGAGAVVASLWPVGDAATRALLEVFYAEVASGDSPGGALADAGALVRSRPGWEHPYYWAAFQVSGLAHGPYEPGLSHLSDEVVGRIEETYQESMERRGGPIMDETTMVRDSQVLLEQMGEEPEAVLEALGPADSEKVVSELGELSAQAAGVRTEADLLALADAVHRLVEDTPALAELLLEPGSDPESRRTVPSPYDTAQDESDSATEKGVEIRNCVAECRDRLQRSLQSGAEERA